MESIQEKRKVRTYAFANKLARSTFDLRQKENKIINAVTSIIPDAKVTVNSDSYTVDGITRGEAIRIGKMLYGVFGDEFAVKKKVMFVGVDDELFDEGKLYYPDICE